MASKDKPLVRIVSGTDEEVAAAHPPTEGGPRIYRDSDLVLIRAQLRLAAGAEEPKLEPLAPEPPEPKAAAPKAKVPQGGKGGKEPKAPKACKAGKAGKTGRPLAPVDLQKELEDMAVEELMMGAEDLHEAFGVGDVGVSMPMLTSQLVASGAMGEQYAGLEQEHLDLELPGVEALSAEAAAEAVAAAGDVAAAGSSDDGAQQGSLATSDGAAVAEKEAAALCAEQAVHFSSSASEADAELDALTFVPPPSSPSPRASPPPRSCSPASVGSAASPERGAAPIERRDPAPTAADGSAAVSERVGVDEALELLLGPATPMAPGAAAMEVEETASEATSSEAATPPPPPSPRPPLDEVPLRQQMPRSGKRKLPPSAEEEAAAQEDAPATATKRSAQRGRRQQQLI